MTIVVVTGDSHCAALKFGFDRLKNMPSSLDIRFRPLGGGGQVPTPFYALEDGGSTVKIVCPRWWPRRFPDPEIDHNRNEVVYAVSMPLNTSRILRDFPWGDFVPWQVRNPDERALSQKLFEAVLWTDAKYAVEFIGALVNVGLNVVVLEGPHFFSDSPYLRHARMDVCRYVSNSYRAMVRARLAEHSVSIVNQPPATLDENGCTQLRYHKDERDAHHGNAAFGEIMMTELTNHVIARGHSIPKCAVG